MFPQKQIVNRIICVFVDVGWYLSRPGSGYRIYWG
jgi:hypothetical protein